MSCSDLLVSHVNRVYCRHAGGDVGGLDIVWCHRSPPDHSLVVSSCTKSQSWRAPWFLALINLPATVIRDWTRRWSPLGRRGSGNIASIIGRRGDACRLPACLVGLGRSDQASGENGAWMRIVRRDRSLVGSLFAANTSAVDAQRFSSFLFWSHVCGSAVFGLVRFSVSACV